MKKSTVSISKRLIGWERASSKAKNWWEQLEDMNSDKQDLVLKLVSELLHRNATIDDFFTACSYSGKEGVTENLLYLDMIKQDRAYQFEQEPKKKKRAYTIH